MRMEALAVGSYKTAAKGGKKVDSVQIRRSKELLTRSEF